MDGSVEALRFRQALAMAETGVILMRQNLRRQDPGATEEVVDARLREWLSARPLDSA